MISNMSEAINEITRPQAKKLFMYSSHDKNLLAVASALKVSVGQNVPYASSIILELLQVNGTLYTVQLLYRNDTTKPPYTLIPTGCSGNCTYQQLVDLTRGNIPLDWTSECMATKSMNKGKIAAIVLSVVGVLVVLAISIIALKTTQRRQYSKQYKQLSYGTYKGMPL